MTEGGNTMYNEEQKQAFLDGLINNHGDLYIKEYISVFKKTEPYEVKNGCDICNFSTEQLVDMYKKFNLKYRTKIVYHGKLVQYVKCSSLSTDAFDKAYEILLQENNEQNENNENRSKSSQNSITYKEIMDFIETLDNPSDKFIIYGLFCGICGKDYIELSYSSMEDSDKETKMIWLAGYDEYGDIILKGRKFFADDKLFQIATESCESKKYIAKCSDGSKMIKNISSDDLRILKRAKKINDNNGNKVHRTTITDRLNKLTQNTKLGRINPSFLYWSGVAYNVKKIALEIGEENITAKKAMRLPEFKKIREQYNIRIEDRSLVLKLEWYLK